MFDSVQVRFNHTEHRTSPLASCRQVPFVDSYLTVLKSVINDIDTEYFWFFANFVDLNTIDLDYIPEQHEKDQIHVWYNKNKEGNVFLIPTKKCKEQIYNLKFLRDYKDINYHKHPSLVQNDIIKKGFSLAKPYEQFDDFYAWLYNKDLDENLIPDFYPSFWEDIKLYTWGQTNDIMLDRKSVV